MRNIHFAQKVFQLQDGKSHVIAEECGECNCQEAVDVVRLRQFHWVKFI
jgi:hypothetical protein